MRLMHWLQPDRRLDYIFVTHAGATGAAPCTTRASCSTSRAAAPAAPLFASDHFGVVADVQIAPGAREPSRDPR